MAIVKMFVGLAFTVLAIRLLGAESWGRFSVVFSVGMMFLFTYSGVYSVIIRELVEVRSLVGDARRSKIGNLVSAAIALTAPGILIIAAAGLSTEHLAWVRPDLAVVVFACTLMTCAQVLTALAISLLEGMGNVRTVSVLPFLGQLGVTLILFGMLLWTHTLTLSAFLLLMTLAYSLEACWALFVAWRRLRGQWIWRFSQDTLLMLIRDGLKLQSSRLVALSTDPINKLALNYFIGPASVAVYDFASKIAAGLQGVFSAYSRLFLQISRDASDFRAASIRRAADYSWALYLFAASLVVCAILSPATGWLRLNASELAVGFMLSALTHWLMTLATPMFVGLISFGAYSFIFRNQLILMLSTLVCGLIFVPLLGTVGVFIGLLLATVLNILLIERHCGQLMPNHETLAKIAKPMALRLVVGLTLLVVPTLVVPGLSPGVLYWTTILSCIAIAAVMIAREPIWTMVGSLWRERFAPATATVLGVDDAR